MALFVAPIAVSAQESTVSVTSGTAVSELGYADLADLVLTAPVIATVTIRSATRIKGPEAADVASGHVRFYIESDVNALVRGREGLPPRIGYVVDSPLDWRGKPPRLKKERMILYARPVSGSMDQVQLAGPRGQQPWSQALEDRTRSVAAEILAPNAPPQITGVGNAFYVAGSLPGEGETQIFLHTADHRPVSLSVLRRPGEQPQWSVALGEIVDEAAAAPKRDTLLWYRLACSLPSELPAASTGALEPADAAQAQEDYRHVIGALGPCRATA